MTYKGIAKGRIIELEEPLPYCEGQAVSVSIEPFRPEQPSGSPQAILKVLQSLPQMKIEDVDEMEQLIRQANLPVQMQGEFESEGA